MASAAEQLAANINFATFSKATELQKRILFAIGALIVYRLGTFIPIPGVDPAALCRRVAELGRRLGREGPPDLALAFVRAEPRIGGVLIGVENATQLANNLALWHRSPLTAAEAAEVARSLADCPDALLDPAQWPRTDTRT